MKRISISVEEETYQVIQTIPTINLYKIVYPMGSFEITRNKYTGEWKVLVQTNLSKTLPLDCIGQEIENNLGIVN